MSTNECTVLYAKVTTRPPVIRRLLYWAAPTVLSYTQSSATFLAFTHWNYLYYQHPFSYDIPSFNCLNFYWKKKNGGVGCYFCYIWVFISFSKISSSKLLPLQQISKIKTKIWTFLILSFSFLKVLLSKKTQKEW